MADPLWILDDLLDITDAQPEGLWSGAEVTNGICIDSRTLERGDLFVALQDQRDGHDFVSAAFDKGASLALVSMDYQAKSNDGALLHVLDPLAALEKIAKAARARLSKNARVIAVTGSAGKTTTKEMLRLCFAHLGKVHASEKSYNNHWGVPLTLARMPRDTDFAVIEIGMNHAGEISPLAKMTRPHVALVTSVLPVHLEHFSGLEAIAKAKAEIFDGLDGTGWAILPRDSSQFELLKKRALKGLGGNLDDIIKRGAIVTFGTDERSDTRLLADRLSMTENGSRGVFEAGDELPFDLALPGRHNALNAMACIAAWFAATSFLPLPECEGDHFPGFAGVLTALASMKMDPVGRGQVFELGNEQTGVLTLIDESYNANPASMRAALENFSLYSKKRRKVAVIGDMLELGKKADDLHGDLVDPINSAQIDVVFACGPHMKVLYEALPRQMRGAYAKNAEELKPQLLDALRDQDIVMIKGSNGSRLGALVEALRSAYPIRNRT